MSWSAAMLSLVPDTERRAGLVPTPPQTTRDPSVPACGQRHNRGSRSAETDAQRCGCSSDSAASSPERPSPARLVPPIRMASRSTLYSLRSMAWTEEQSPLEVEHRVRERIRLGQTFAPPAFRSPLPASPPPSGPRPARPPIGRPSAVVQLRSGRRAATRRVVGMAFEPRASASRSRSAGQQDVRTAGVRPPSRRRCCRGRPAFEIRWLDESDGSSPVAIRHSQKRAFECGCRRSAASAGDRTTTRWWPCQRQRRHGRAGRSAARVRAHRTLRPRFAVDAGTARSRP